MEYSKTNSLGRNSGADRGDMPHTVDEQQLVDGQAVSGGLHAIAKFENPEDAAAFLALKTEASEE